MRHLSGIRHHLDVYAKWYYHAGYLPSRSHAQPQDSTRASPLALIPVASSLSASPYQLHMRPSQPSAPPAYPMPQPFASSQTMVPRHVPLASFMDYTLDEQWPGNVQGSASEVWWTHDPLGPPPLSTWPQELAHFETQAFPPAFQELAGTLDLQQVVRRPTDGTIVDVQFDQSIPMESGNVIGLCEWRFSFWAHSRVWQSFVDAFGEIFDANGCVDREKFNALHKNQLRHHECCICGQALFGTLDDMNIHIRHIHGPIHSSDGHLNHRQYDCPYVDLGFSCSHDEKFSHPVFGIPGGRLYHTLLHQALACPCGSRQPTIQHLNLHFAECMIGSISPTRPLFVNWFKNVYRDNKNTVVCMPSHAAWYRPKLATPLEFEQLTPEAQLSLIKKSKSLPTLFLARASREKYVQWTTQAMTSILHWTAEHQAISGLQGEIFVLQLQCRSNCFPLVISKATRNVFDIAFHREDSAKKSTIGFMAAYWTTQVMEFIEEKQASILGASHQLQRTVTASLRI